MKFHKIFVEESIQHSPEAKQILRKFPSLPVVPIKKVEDVFEKVKKPYLQKRDHLNVFIGEKRGNLVKKAPPAYGELDSPHYYFIHAYNCLYECEYCYLQGYFHSPDLVFFINHDDIADEITRIVDDTPPSITPWFHAGEFSDSLALSHVTNELPFYWDLFQKLPQAKLELRTKSNNISVINKLSPVDNIIISYSMATEWQIKNIEHGTPPLKKRLEAMQKLFRRNFPLGLHLDPIIYQENLFAEYEKLFEQLHSYVPISYFSYISLGVVRFTKSDFHAFQKNYPESPINTQEFITSFDNKVRYIKPFRLHILNTLKKMLISQGIKEKRIYLCME